MTRRRRALQTAAALAVAVAAQVELAVVADRATGSLTGLRIATAVICAALLLARRQPAGAVVVATVGLFAFELIGTAPVAAPFLLWLFLLGNVGWRGSLREGVAALVTASLGLAMTQVAHWELGLADLVVNVVVAVAAWWGPWLVRSATDRRVEAEVAAQRVADEAVARERRVIARDLHDSVAHAVGVMTLQAGAGRQIDDPERVREVLFAIEASGRRAMEDLHSFLGLLKADGEPDSPGLAGIEDLLAGVRATGCAVRADLKVAEGVPMAAQTTAFRVVQEAVTNALKHQDLIRLEVTVRTSPLTVEVRSVGPFLSTPGGGRGLPGMRERVDALGGTCSAGAVGPQEWVVRAELTSTLTSIPPAALPVHMTVTDRLSAALPAVPLAGTVGP